MKLKEGNIVDNRKIYIENIMSFEEFLRKKSFLTEGEILRRVNHEGVHFGMATRLGYSPLYEIFFKDESLSHFKCSVFVREVLPKHSILIALAPEIPSKGDKKIALDAWQKVQERRYFLG